MAHESGFSRISHTARCRSDCRARGPSRATKARALRLRHGCRRRARDAAHPLRASCAPRTGRTSSRVWGRTTPSPTTQRGHGKSERAPDYSLRAFADDAIHVLRDLIKSPTWSFGHSLGALAALAAAAEEPALVRGSCSRTRPSATARPGPLETYAPIRDALAANEPIALRKAVDKFPLPSPGPRGERTYGEMRGFYASERVLTYFKDVDPAFIDAKIAGEDGRTSSQDGWRRSRPRRSSSRASRASGRTSTMAANGS